MKFHNFSLVIACVGSVGALACAQKAEFKSADGILTASKATVSVGAEVDKRTSSGEGVAASSSDQVGLPGSTTASGVGSSSSAESTPGSESGNPGSVHVPVEPADGTTGTVEIPEPTDGQEDGPTAGGEQGTSGDTPQTAEECNASPGFAKKACSNGASGNPGMKKEKDKAKKEKKIKESFGNDEESLGNCAKHFQKKVLDMKISGAHNTATVAGKDVMAFKITGNQNILEINYANTAASTAEGQQVQPTFSGLCVFAAGNKASVKVSVKDVLLQKVVFVGRGNQPDFDVKIEGTGKVGEIVFDAHGHVPSLDVSAPAGYPCDKLIVNSAKFTGTCKVAP